MQNVLLEEVKKGNGAIVYTITFKDNDTSEFTKFITKFKDNATLQRDYQLIILAIQKILETGALERYFRTEGKMKDNVCALPIESGKLRLYCLRLSDKILIAGNGGIKNSKTYQESNELNGYVVDLQEFDKLLGVAIKNNTISIEQMEIGLDNKTIIL